MALIVFAAASAILLLLVGMGVSVFLIIQHVPADPASGSGLADGGQGGVQYADSGIHSTQASAAAPGGSDAFLDNSRNLAPGRLADPFARPQRQQYTVPPTMTPLPRMVRQAEVIRRTPAPQQAGPVRYESYMVESMGVRRTRDKWLIDVQFVYASGRDFLIRVSRRDNRQVVGFGAVNGLTEPLEERTYALDREGNPRLNALLVEIVEVPGGKVVDSWVPKEQ